MGMLVDGKWRDEDPPAEVGKAGNFQRVDSVFRDRVTADGSSGFKAEAGRYHLYVAYTCPWAHRTQIYLALKKLNSAISVAIAVPGLRDEGWTFEDSAAFPDCPPDRVNGFRYLHQAYAASNPHYTGKVTVPTLWDKKTGRIVNNESSEIIRMLNSRVRRHRRRPDGFLSEAAARRDRPHQRAGLQQRQQRRLPLRLCPLAGGLRRSLRRAVRHARRDRSAPRPSALSGRQSNYRSGLAAFPDAGAFRRRLFLDLQVQSQPHRRLSKPLELYARALSGPRRRRDGQAALLRDRLLFDQTRQSDRHHPQRDAGRFQAAA